MSKRATPWVAMLPFGTIAVAEIGDSSGHSIDVHFLAAFIIAGSMLLAAWGLFQLIKGEGE